MPRVRIPAVPCSASPRIPTAAHDVELAETALPLKVTFRVFQAASRHYKVKAPFWSRNQVSWEGGLPAFYTVARAQHDLHDVKLWEITRFLEDD